MHCLGNLNLENGEMESVGASDKHRKDGMQWLFINVTGPLPYFLNTLSILACEYPKVVIGKVTNGHDDY